MAVSNFLSKLDFEKFILVYTYSSVFSFLCFNASSVVEISVFSLYSQIDSYLFNNGNLCPSLFKLSKLLITYIERIKRMNSNKIKIILNI